MNEIAKYGDMINEIKEVLQSARQNVAQQVNTELLTTYWNIGRIIVEHEQQSRERAEYGQQTLKELSRVLTKEFGKGFSRSNLQNMRAFYLTYQKCQTPSGKLSWSHYCELLSISDPDKRSFYEKEAINSGWSVRELKRQMATSLYERLLLSDGKTNKETVLALAQKGIEMASPGDIIKDPYVFEFLGIPESKPVMESELEKALVQQIEKFLLELGRGFMFVGTQQRVTLNNIHYYVDMVFYNKPLRAYVLIELKTVKLLPEAVGQLNMYLNYYAAEVNDPDDNPPIGIILCTDKTNVEAEYALGGLSNNIFASRYTYVIPNKDELIAQVEAVLREWHEPEADGEKEDYGCAGVAILGTVAAGVIGLAAHFAFLPGIMLTHNIRAQLPVCGQYRFPEVSAQQRIADCLHTYARVAVIQHKAAPAVVVGTKAAGQLFHLAILCFV